MLSIFLLLLLAMMVLLLLLAIMRMKQKVPELVEQVRAQGDTVGHTVLD
jgi:hypothetical protein